MTADVITLRPWYLDAACRVITIESLAHDDRMTDAEKAAELREVAHPSLTGLRLWLAWLAAEDAILIRDWTPPGDCDFKVYEERAEAAVSVLLHGNHGGDAA